MELLWLALVLLLLFLLYKYSTRTHGTLERLGMPVIRPLPLVGSVPRPWAVVAALEDQKNANKYGGVWGQYEGCTPQVFIADVEMMKRVMIKDFDHFADRPIDVFDFELGRDMLDFLSGERWKTVRALISPALSSGAKLKAMMPTLQQCAEDACTRLETKMKQDPVIRVKDDVYGPLVLDVMAQFSFGLKVPDIDDKTNPFVKMASAFGDSFDTESVMAGVMTFFPTLSNYMLKKMFVPTLKYAKNVLRKSIKERRAEGIDRPDLVGVLMDAIDNKVPTKEFRDLNIDEELILLQGAEMLMAAYDTTGTTLALTTCQLALHPDMMARVVEEVDAVGELTYDSVNQQLPLLEAVMQETMRVTPLVVRHFRLCVKDWEYDNVRIPAGTQVLIPVMPFHMDADVFPDPERFLPDRWLGEGGRQLGQYHWMPFGLGPRVCPGMRLATLEVKYVLAYILKRFRIGATEKTKLVLTSGPIGVGNYKPIYAKIEKRE